MQGNALEMNVDELKEDVEGVEPWDVFPSSQDCSSTWVMNVRTCCEKPYCHPYGLRTGMTWVIWSMNASRSGSIFNISPNTRQILYLLN
jgi:hypothetical protein